MVMHIVSRIQLAFNPDHRISRSIHGHSPETPLVQSRAAVDRITAAKQAEGGSNATVNRTLALLRAILRRCHREWERLDRAPAVRLLKEPTLRNRFLTRPEAAALLQELPQHLRDMATFALSTGLRAANITGLCWDQVDMERKQAWVHPDQAKARRAIAVPLNEAAMEVLQRQKGNHFVRVFVSSPSIDTGQ